MNNGAYFANLRKYIVQNANIEHLEILRDPKLFHGALQSTMLFVLKKGKNKGNYIFNKNGIMIFSEKAEYLKKSFANKPTLKELGYKAKTGRLVWNQNRHLLTNNPEEGVPLIWAHNITEDGLKLPITKEDKPQYVKTLNYDIGPAIVVNRITGTVTSSKLKAGIIPPGVKFIAENHVNVIFCSDKSAQVNLGFKTPRAVSIKNIAEQLTSEKMLSILKSITGNTQISKTELENFFPISNN